MKFPELCERLKREVGSVKVKSNAYPGMGSSFTEGTIFWVHGGVFEVGFEERGVWNPDRTFETEDAACEYLYELLARKPKIRERTPEEIERSRKINEEYALKMEARREYWRQHGEYPPED